MNDCPNAEMRDQLCDVVHRTLSDADCRRVEEHIATCPDCAAEIELLQRARAVLSRATPAVNTSAIVAALPRPQRGRTIAQQARTMSFSNWRVAASIAVIALGAASLSLVRVQGARNDGAPDSIGTVIAANMDAHTLSFSGRLSALEDEDLEQLLADIGEFDGATPAEPGTVLPVPTWDGGTP